MTISPLAGKPAPKELLIDLVQLERHYYERRPDFDDPGQRVSFGTSGHRGTPLRGSFTETHILAITPATANPWASAGRSIWERIRTRCPGQLSAPPSKCWPETASIASFSEVTG
jgi:hypothetical protein